MACSFGATVHGCNGTVNWGEGMALSVSMMELFTATDRLGMTLSVA